VDRIFIDNIEFTRQVAGLEEIELTYQLDDSTKTVNYATTSELVFGGIAYDYLYEKFFVDRIKGFTHVSKCKVIKDCCGNREYFFDIISEGVQLCPDECAIKVVLRATDEVGACFDRLNSEVFWKKGLMSFMSNSAYFSKIKYCEPVDIWRLVVLYFWLLAKATPIIFIIDIFDEIFGSGDGFVNRVDDWTVGAGNFHVSFNANKAIEYNVKKCGLEWVSPALQGSYSNLYILSCFTETGIDQKHINSVTRCRELFELNAPNQTIFQLLDSLKPVFDYDYRIIRNKLIFDHPENLVEEYEFLFDLDQKVLEGVMEPFCYQFVQLENYAYGRFEYGRDSIDVVGNRMINFYNDIVDWNTAPTNEFQKGELNNRIDFSPVTFMRDQRQSGLEFAFFVNTQRESPFVGRTHKNEPIITSGMSIFPKLLLIENADQGTIVKRSLSDNRFEYQRDLFFQENGPGTNLYNRFHRRRNPRLGGRKTIQIDNLTLAFDCDILDKLDEFKTNTYIKTRFGKATFESATVNFETGTITFENILV
jgi:hypothetical protein